MDDATKKRYRELARQQELNGGSDRLAVEDDAEVLELVGGGAVVEGYHYKHGGQWIFVPADREVVKQGADALSVQIAETEGALAQWDRWVKTFGCGVGWLPDPSPGDLLEAVHLALRNQIVIMRKLEDGSKADDADATS